LQLRMQLLQALSDMFSLPDGERALTGGDTQNIVGHGRAMAEVIANAMSRGGAAQTGYPALNTHPEKNSLNRQGRQENQI
jgi:hypothetical protein